MKNIALIILSLLIYNYTNAQDCGVYHPVKTGTTLTYTYSKKANKPENTTVMTVLSTENTTNGIKINVAGTVKDKKGKEELKYTYTAWCDGEDFYLDMKSMVASLAVQDLSSYKIESKDLKFPKDLKEGQNLENASLTLSVEGPVNTGITTNITNRKVEAFEKVTTAAGTFDCVKISYSFNSKVMFIKSSGSAIEWFAKEIGTIRSETYDKNGKLMGINELTSIN